MIRRCLAATALLTWMAGSRQAQAEDSSAMSEAPSDSAASETTVAPAIRIPTSRNYKTEWYGGYTLAVDGAAILTLPFLVGVGVYAVGAPIVHLAKGEPGNALGSLGLRIGMPLVLGLVGAAIAQQRECTDDLGGNCGFGQTVMIAAGALVGGLGAIAIDAAALAYRTVPVAPPPRAHVSYVPNLLVGRDRAMVTVSGSF